MDFINNLKAEDFAQVEQAYQVNALLDVEPALMRLLSALPDSCNINYYFAKLCEQKGDLVQMETSLRKAIDIESEFRVQAINLLLRHQILARIFSEEHLLDEAIKIASTKSDLELEYVQLRILKGFIMINENKFSDCEDLFRGMFTKTPENIDQVNLFGWVRAKLLLSDLPEEFRILNYLREAAKSLANFYLVKRIEADFEKNKTFIKIRESDQNIVSSFCESVYIDLFASEPIKFLCEILDVKHIKCIRVPISKLI